MAEPIRWQDRWWHQQPDGSWLLFDEETQSWELFSGPAGQTAYAPSPGMSSGSKWVIGVVIGLVVLFIVMVLAAIAIPVFLRQREKGSIAQVESALKEAAVTQELTLTSEGAYTPSLADLERQGLQYPDDVQLSIARASATAYCIEGTHELLEDVWSYDSEIGRPREGRCF